MTIWASRLAAVEQAGQLRTLRQLDTNGAEALSPDGPKTVFCANDYLGLAGHPRLVEAVHSALDTRGVGAGASRLVSGNSSLHAALEEAFAGFVGFPESVLFSSGYQANVGTISALTAPGDIIFSDERCHASIIDGCRLSRARVEIFAHNDTTHLQNLLLAHGDAQGLRLIVTEGIFSMDGDTPPLSDICDLAEKYGAAVYLDEAHSIGVLGPGGRGLAASLGLTDRIDVLIGTFGKALGVSGAGAACQPDAARLLKSTARSLLYSTAAPPLLCAAAIAAIKLVRDADPQRDILFRHIARFRRGAREAGLPICDSDTPIQPLLIGDSGRTMEISSRLWDRGFFVQGIRPPTVAPGTARLRITLCAHHTDAQIDGLIRALTEAVGT